MAICSLLSLSGQSFAATTEIRFAKGSTCGGFEGNVIGRKFTLGLLKNQTFYVNPDGRSAYRVVVKSPSGKVIRPNGGSMAGWDINQNGKHTVIITPFNKNNKYANVEFCAY